MNNYSILMVAHLFAYFYLHKNPLILIGKKEAKWKFLSYPIIMMIAFFSVYQSLMVTITLGTIVTGTHYLFDNLVVWTNKHRFISKEKPVNELSTFIINQILHCSIIAMILYFYRENNELQYNNIFLFIAILLGILIPASFIIAKLIDINIQNSSRKRSERIFNSELFILDEGTIIGCLERLLIFFLAISGQLGSIGFVIAAKTMVRYGQFIDPPDGKGNNNSESGKSFAAKYLIGTLSSILLAIIGVIIWNRFSV